MTLGKDQFANQAVISIVESAANTLTFKKLETGISLNEKVAWVINRAEYTVSAMNQTQYAQDADGLTYGLSVSNTFTTLNFTEGMILDLNSQNIQIASAVGEMLHKQPFIKDFSQLPGGGIIVPPTPLYGFVQGSGLTSATTVIVRLWYTLLQLKVDQYWELVEARRIIQS